MNFLNSMPAIADEVILGLNIVFFTLVIYSILLGFFRGTKKSVYYLIVTLIVLGGGLLFSGVICNALMGIDLSSLQFSFEMGDKTYLLTTPKETIELILREQIFSGGSSSTITASLIYGLIETIFRLIWFIVLVILSLTLFGWISGIIWLFIRPKKKMIKGKKRRPKPKMGSRFGGAGIGLAKGLAFSLLLFFIFAGIASVAQTCQDAMSAMNNENVSYNMIITPESATLVQLESSEDEDVFEEYQEIFDILLAYKESAPGKIFGSIKIKGSSVDEMVFDEFFKINVDELKTNVKLRNEIKKVAEAMAECPELLESGLSFESVVAMTKDPAQNAKLKSAIEKLTSLDIIKVTVPVALEIVLLSDLVINDETITDEELMNQIKSIDFEELKAIDYGAEFKNIGYAFVDMVSLFDEEGNFDFVSMDPNTVRGVFDSIGSLEIINKIAPVAISYVLTAPDIVSSFEEFGIDPEALGLGDITDWSGEIEILGDVLAAFLEIGLTNEDLSDFSNIEIDDELIGKIDNFTEVLFTSNIIKNAVPVVAKIGVDQLPEDYADLISIPNETDGVYWEKELKPLIKAALALLSTGILTPEEGKTTQDVLKELSDEEIAELALHLSESTIITESLNNVITNLVSAELDSEGNVIREGLLGDVVVTGFDSSDEWNKQEIENIFKALVTIIKSDIISSTDYLQTLSELKDEDINELTTALSNSKFITKNLSPILSYLLKSLDSGDGTFEVVTLEENEWTNTELNNIFFAFREIAKSGLLDSESTSALEELSDESIDNLATYISQSKFITRNLTPVMDMLLSGMDLGNIEIKGFENAEDWTKLEISSLLKSAKIIIKYSDDLTQLVKLSEEQMDILTSSTLITDVLVDFIKEYSGDGQPLEIVEGAELVKDNEWRDTKNENIQFTYSSGVITITKDNSLDVNKYYLYVKNSNDEFEKITSTSSLTINLNDLLNDTSNDLTTLPSESDIKVVAYEFGEIRNMFLAIQAICKDEEISADNIIKALSKITDNDMYVILESIICSETLITQVESYAENEDAIVCIPEGDLKALNADGTKDRTAWLEQADGTHGELFNALKAMSILFNGEDFSNLTFDTDMFTSIENEDIETVLNSRIINETLIVKIEEMSNQSNKTIYIPSELKTNNEIDRTKWNNNKESTHLLIALKLMFSGETIDVDGMSLQKILDEDTQAKILRSLVICETIKENILAIEQIKQPEGLATDTLSGWKNEYNTDGELTDRGEISFMLEAVEVAMNIDENTTINNLGNEEISLNSVVGDSQRPIVLRSKVLATTIKSKITENSEISLPENHDVVGDDNYIDWYNTYNGETLVETGELDALLAASNKIFGDNEIDFANVYLSTVIDNKDDILKSIIITQTFKEKISDTLDVPSELQGNSLSSWKNIYNSNDTINSYGEINYLLEALNIALSIDDSTTLNNISADSFNLNEIVQNQDSRDTVLHSLVLSETIKNKILSESALNKPAGYDDINNTNNYIEWNNDYEEETISRGELDAIFAAMHILFGDNEITFSNLDGFDYTVLFDDSAKRRTVLSSKMLAETMIVKIEDMISSDSLHMPSYDRVPGLYDVNNRTLWWNLEYGELIHFAEGSNHLLTEQEKESLSDLEFGVDKVYSHMMNEEEREIIVKSYILAETLSDNFKELELYTQHHASVTEVGVDLDENANWYGIEIVDNERVIERKELWHLISSIHIMLGDEYTSAKAFEIDDIFGTDSDHRSPLAPTEEEVAGQHYFSFDWENMDVFLESLLMQTIFEDVLFEVIDDGELKNKVIAPEYGYEVNGVKYLRFEYTFNNYKVENPESLNESELANLVEYDSKRMIEAFIIMNIAGLNYNELSNFEGAITDPNAAMALVETLVNVNWSVLVDAFFISRAFRGSIETILNPVFESVYTFAETIAPYYGKSIDSWNTVKLLNDNYKYPMTKENGANQLLTDIQTILNNINSVFN